MGLGLRTRVTVSRSLLVLSTPDLRTPRLGIGTGPFRTWGVSGPVPRVTRHCDTYPRQWGRRSPVLSVEPRSRQSTPVPCLSPWSSGSPTDTGTTLSWVGPEGTRRVNGVWSRLARVRGRGIDGLHGRDIRVTRRLLNLGFLVSRLARMFF